jgi:hypothetical protein
MILDCWNSSSVAAEAIESLDYPEMGIRRRTSRPGDKVGFFTSGFGVSWTTAIVLSENADLVNESRVKVDGCFESFGIFSSLFMRHFLDIVAYTDKNPRLADFAQELGICPGVRCGLKAEFQSVDSSFGDRRLRDFFPIGVNSCDLVVGGQVRFCDILPNRPFYGLLDEIVGDFCEGGENESISMKRIWVRRSNGEIIAGSGGLLSEDDETERRIGLLFRQPRRTMSGELPTHHSIGAISRYMMKTLEERGYVPKITVDKICENETMEKLYDFVRVTNQSFRRFDVDIADAMIRHLEGIPYKEVTDLILEGRDFVAQSD